MERETLIFHVDVNSAFLSWSAVARLCRGEKVDLREIPSVVGGDAATRHGIVLAKSTPAKKYGIQTAQPLAEACRLCPNLVVVPSDFDVYEKCSEAFIEILRGYSDLVEKFSIDEAFIDMTESLRMGVTQETQLLQEDTVQTQAAVAKTETAQWRKRAVVFANKIKDEIYEKLGFTVNIGISTNKLLAKMASDFQKPNRVHTLFPEEVPYKMWPLPVEELLFVGKSSAARLRSLGIRTIGDLAHADVSMLQSHFKKQGLMFSQYANGQDSAFLRTHPADNKGYGHSTTLPVDISDAGEAKRILLSLAEKVGKRLREDEAHASVVSVTIRYYDLTNTSHQLMLEAPTNANDTLHQATCKLFDELWDGKTPIRLLGVRTSKITRGEVARQLNLFDRTDYEKREKLDKALDEIRARFGSQAVSRASLMRPKFDESEKSE